MNDSHRIALTGANGALGQALLKEIQDWPNTESLSLVREKKTAFQHGENIHYEQVNFSDSDMIRDLIEAFHPTALLHCAAAGMQLPRPGWNELIKFNIGVSQQLCEIASGIAGCQFIHVSTGLAYRDQGRPLCEGDPLESLHPYAATKAAAELVVRSVATERNVPLTIVRPFSFSGRGDFGSRLFPSLLQAAVENGSFLVRNGDQIRDYCAVDDIAHGVASILARRKSGVFNLGSGNDTPLKHLVNQVIQELELSVELEEGDQEPGSHDSPFLVADITRARTELGWSPRINFPFAIWQLAQVSFPSLKLKQPRQTL